MSALDKRYLDYYTPLVEKFIADVKRDVPSTDVLKGMPQPHFPVFGSGYEKSAAKLVFVGRDTRGWGDVTEFLKKGPRAALADDLDEFKSLKYFVKDAKNRQTFWGFVMMTLAALHGHADWGVMKKDGHEEILGSFAWAEANAVELPESVKKHLPKGRSWSREMRKVWENVRKAGKPLDRVEHLIEVLKPHVIIVLNERINRESYFDGYELKNVPGTGNSFEHHHLLNKEQKKVADLLIMPHPRRMNFGKIKPDGFKNEIVRTLDYTDSPPQFELFASGDPTGSKTTKFILEHAPEKSPEFDKYAFVAWVAAELTKRKSCMSVPTLAKLANKRGYRTGYGEEYGGGRGTYRLVSGTYHRLDRAGKKKEAAMVADAYRKPDFTYAYEPAK